MESRATISQCGKYRYRLERIWNREGLKCIFVMLNPSTADEGRDDPTIRRCIGLAQQWGYGSLLVLNLFAYRATDPRELKMLSREAAIGPNNDQYLIEGLDGLNLAIAAWGNHGLLWNRGAAVRARFLRRFLHLGSLTSQGQPRHPLYVSKTTQLRELDLITPC